jgi:hypothetical protein
MTDDSLPDTQPEAPSIAPAIAAALAYIDGLHAFAIAVIRADVDAMGTARHAIEDAARRIASQDLSAGTDAR